MINLRQWRDYIESIAISSNNIRKGIFIATRERFKEKTKNLTEENYPVLLSVLPDIAPASKNEDNIADLNIMLFFVLVPIRRAEFDQEVEFLNWELGASCCADIKNKLRNDYFDRLQYPFLEGLNFKSFVQEAVWNFEGFMGWSIAFELKSEGYDYSDALLEKFTYGQLSYVIIGNTITGIIDVVNNTQFVQNCVLFFRLGNGGNYYGGYYKQEVNIPPLGIVTIKQSILIDNVVYRELNVSDNTFTLLQHTPFVNPLENPLENLTYGNLSVTRDKEIITSTFPVTNNSTTEQDVTIFFEIAGQLVSYTHTIPGESTYLFSHVITSASAQTVIVRDEELTQLGSVSVGSFVVFTYNTFSQARNGADVTCTLPVTNNSGIAQPCTVYFKLGDYIVQLTATIANGATHTFSYTFLDLDSDIEHSITALSSVFETVGVVVVPVTGVKSTYGLGLLYNWPAVNTGKLAPIGCHVPSEAEWTELSTYLGGTSVAGAKLKSKRLQPVRCGWTVNAGTAGTNTSNFNALPGGYRRPNEGNFGLINNNTYFWATTEATITTARSVRLDYNSNASGIRTDPKISGFSVRCLLDNPSEWYEGMTKPDYDGNIYSTVKIGNQVWLGENLKTTSYNDGTPIPLETNGTNWINLTTGAYCSYGNNSVIEYRKCKKASDVDEQLLYFESLEKDGILIMNTTKTIYIESTVNRTSDSDAAVAFLTSKGYIIIIEIW
ncbi:MAG: hypothetical protein EHM12_08015 [Dehalococcoidia bacterium]|nr:MAG: hypothetical protein EHM12_08015 [Dehalococcoidia bacterium]